MLDLLAFAVTGLVLGFSVNQFAPTNSTATPFETTEDTSAASEPQVPPSVEDINKTWFEYPFASQFLFANAAVWPLFWAFCFIVRPCFEKLVRKYTLIRKLTGEKLARTKSMTKWTVADRPGAYYDPFAGSEMPTKVSKKATGRFIPRLSRLILFYGTSSGWTYAYRMALFSTVLACAFMRRREHIVSDKAGYQVVWELLLDQLKETPWKVFHFLAGKILVENSIPIVTGVVGTLAAIITAMATLCSSCRETTRRLNELERERSAMMQAAPHPGPVTKVLSVDGKLRRLKSLPAEVASGIHAGLNSAASDGMRRQASTSRLDMFVRAKSGSVSGIKLDKCRVRDPTIADIGHIPNLDAIRWIGARPPVSVDPSAPSADE